MNINNEIREKLIAMGASIVGFADLSVISEHNRKAFKYGNKEKVKCCINTIFVIDVVKYE